MKVMLLTHSFTPEISPPQRRWSIIVDELGQLGHEITVVTPKSNRIATKRQRRLLDSPYVTLQHYPSMRRSKTMLGKVLKHGVDAVLSVPAVFRGQKPDVIVATVPAIPTLIVGFVASRLRRVPLVVDLRDAWPDLLSESQVIKFRWVEPVISKLISFIVNRSDMLVTVTQGLAFKMHRNGMENIATIPNGVETERADLEVSQRESDGEFHILYLGNIGRSQGLETVIRAMEHVPENVRLRIVGQGTEKAKLVRLAMDLGLDVDFQDPVYGQRVLENYSWADTCLVSLRPDWPSFNHTVPSKLYELLYLNQHVTGLVRGEAADIIRDSNAGAVIEQDASALTSYINEVVANPKILQTNRRGTDWVMKHGSLRQAGRDYANLLSTVIDAHANR
ncbi:glycosyltransferase family 4 protein [Glutamicibacter mysorens]|uniref:glycosyltransferase family 4 protein n=1 Tax=Glutamicibacter mysorens TaxID=257984 RepID=UPI0020C6F4F7|nr:glycosyltransferase family 4 protein [Glutamicibacter mysorens]UTM48814.1 glycosyltransferase family 4 protein [Glutamicibacter mysorens]